MSSIVVLVGNPQPSSRTRLVAEEVARQLAARSGAEVEPTIDLADVADRLFRFPDETVDALLQRVTAADVLVVASPTYKATYTGLLKSFLDRYGANALAGVTAVPLLTIGGPAHALAVEHALRPLLVELGASTPTRGLAFPAGEVERRSELASAWLDAEWHRLAPALDSARVDA
ncbi:NADPH-dependent FMN reductase [Microbacterium kyungheense]|uniref:FMN reductase n=1 Tax=Microbacterium kyungheense TaxID=1263636 RepID=A0A543FJD3_9MICO|nr:NAD(P)H-dependent oxidoreductase [Microbacterium kyungheense]TQM33824.1 FMN reductase [Microbacterium kyungheense]